MRILLACAVVVLHSVSMTYGNGVANWLYSRPIIHALSMVVLPMFFSLSGFLVAGSLLRCRSLFSFLGLRVIRIYPALTVEVLLSAFILGAFFTTLPLGSYFADKEFLRYLVNVTGHISYTLPGVFESNPVPNLVNRQLWTVPYELYCYIVLSVLAAIGFARRRHIFLLGVVGVHIMYVATLAVLRPHHFVQDRFVGHVTGIDLVMAFLIGVVVYFYRDKLPFSKVVAFISAGLCLVLFSFPAGTHLGLYAAAYLTAWLGLQSPKGGFVLRGADYSYGVYLYGWPVQQALVALNLTPDPISNSVATLAITFGIAAFSWHLIEKPALKAKGPLLRIEARYLKFRDSFTQRVFGMKGVKAGG